MRSKNILITGGLGFIGSALARKLVQLDANVTLVDSMTPEYGGNLANIEDIKNLVKINISDVRDAYSMKYLVKGIDYIFNLAGQTSHMDSMKNPFIDLEINSRAQLSILEACRNHNKSVKIIFASTRQLYGRPEYLPVDEKHPINPVDINGINKLAGESYHLLYNNIYNIRSCALRLTNTYGPGMRIKDARQTFVGIWIRNLIEGKPFEVWGGEQLRDFNYVDDVVNLFLMVAKENKTNGKVFNLGSEEIVNLVDLAKILVSIKKGGEFNIHEFPAERKKIDIGDYYSNYNLIKKTTGWKPKICLKEGLKKTVEYYEKRLKEYL